ncbi:MAG: hypothetical protein IPM92_12525 [Saprospiraceae bacterium]|nr:hypothetical protein [Saprospiraceae bacterium]
MNNLIKLMAFVCLIFTINTANAQRSATVTPDGLIVLDATLQDLAPEYVANLSRFNFTSFQEANNYFFKYIEKSAGRGITFLFDIANQKLIISIDVANQGMVPRAISRPVNVNDINYYLRAVYEGRI